jgi:hypothetical protein
VTIRFPESAGSMTTMGTGPYSLSASFRCAGSAREPGIQDTDQRNQFARPVFMDSRPGPDSRPGMRRQSFSRVLGRRRTQLLHDFQDLAPARRRLPQTRSKSASHGALRKPGSPKVIGRVLMIERPYGFVKRKPIGMKAAGGGRLRDPRSS